MKNEIQWKGVWDIAIFKEPLSRLKNQEELDTLQNGNFMGIHQIALITGQPSELNPW